MPQFLWYTISMKKHKIVLCFLAVFFFILSTCETGLEGYLDLQRTMIPVSNEAELRAAMQKDDAVIGLVKDITISSPGLDVPVGKIITVFAWDRDITLGLGDTGPMDPIFEVSGTLILGDSRSNGTLVLDGKLIAPRHTALVKISEKCTMNNGVVIKGNIISSLGHGGGVNVEPGGTFIMNGGEISGNATVGSGGGVNVDGIGIFTMTGGIIRGNQADTQGGGVAISGSGTFTKKGGTIYGDDGSPKSNKTFPPGNGAAICSTTPPYTREYTVWPGDNLP